MKKYQGCLSLIVGYALLLGFVGIMATTFKQYASLVILALVVVVVVWLARFRRRNPLAAEVAVGWPPGIEKDVWAQRFGWVGVVLFAFIPGVLAAFLFVALTYPTRSDLAARHGQRIDTYYGHLKQLTSSFPARGAITKSQCRRMLSPLPRYSSNYIRNELMDNVDFLAEGKLPGDARKYDFDTPWRQTTRTLDIAFEWRFPRYRGDREPGRRASLWEKERMDRIATLRYAVVYRVLEPEKETLKRLKKEGDEHWAKAHFKIDGVLLDLEAGDVCCEFVAGAIGYKNMEPELFQVLDTITSGMFVVARD